MRIRSVIFSCAALFVFCTVGVAANDSPVPRLPYQEAGLTQREAVSILLDRFAFGARPGEVDRVMAKGLEQWLEEQVSGNLPDHKLESRLASLRTLTLSTREIATTYPRPGMVRAQAHREGVIPRSGSPKNHAETRGKLRAFARRMGYRPQRELIEQLSTQKLLRAVYSENQLVEVLVDFWFNHFNVSIRHNRVRPFVLPYERDAIRPHVLGHFRDLLGATAKHPAMLLYLDNVRSTAPDGTPTTMALAIPHNSFGIRARMARRRRRKTRRHSGINENYARELMELHTLGVDGGYTQQDVIEVARAFTGWTIVPPGPRGERLQRRVARGTELGFIQDGNFLFRADTHDANPKTIVGKTFPAGGGKEEGERVLDILAHHPATARHISYKLAARFVCDEPPKRLVADLTERFMETSGNLRLLVRTIAYSPEFWREGARRTKIKSPFEVTVSALRALNSDVHRAHPTLQWIARMGQPLYAYNAPTGYPDRAEAWINTGSLFNRMNFGLRLALGRIPGVFVDLAALHDGSHLEAVSTAESYAALILPERDLSETLRLMTPFLQDPEFPDEVFVGTARNSGPGPPHVVGIILGSPEFQRR